jgi:hypothetical protein
MSLNYFIVKNEHKDSYDIVSCIEDKNLQDEFNFVLSKNIFNTNNARTAFPIFNASNNKLNLKPGDVFQIDSSSFLFGIEVDKNKQNIFLSNKENNLFSLDDDIKGITKINDLVDLKHNKLSFNESDLETLQFFEKKSKEPNEAIVLCYEDEDSEIKTTVLTFKGLATFFDDELDYNLFNDKVGLYHVTNIEYNPVKSSHESFYDDDIEVKSNFKTISLDDASKYMNISKEDLLKKIIESYPFIFEGDIMENLNQFSKEKNNFAPK